MRWISIILSLTVFVGCASEPSMPVMPEPDEPKPIAVSEDEAAELNLKLGIGYMQSGHFDIALEKLKKALSYNDSLSEAHNAIAVLYEEKGDTKLAEQHYSRAVKLDSSYGLARLNYGRFLCDNGRPSEGEKQYLAAVAIPDFDAAEAAYSGAAVCALAMPDLERADAYLQKAIELSPKPSHTLYQMADFSYAQGKYQQAHDFLQRYHSRAPYSPESLWLGISIEKALGNQQQLRVYTQLLSSRFASSDQARRLKQSE
jgi:type IV pilus assembly protein PilF